MPFGFPAKPKSVRGLLLASFGLVALPLIIAVIYSVYYLGQLSAQGEQLVKQGVQATRYSRQLTDTITSMERSARQYGVLGNEELREQFNDQYRQFETLLMDLKLRRLTTEHVAMLDKLSSLAADIRRPILAQPAEAADIEAALTRFENLRELSRGITELSNQFIDRELVSMEKRSTNARFFLLLNFFAVLPAAFLLMLVFTALISKPIAQVKNAIARLGEGKFDIPVVVSAPSAELDDLGSQLDWMRRRLADLEAEQNQFLRQMSHELKTPLASIREGVELIRDRSLGPLTESQAEVADILQSSSLELLSLIENLLNFSAWQQHRSQLDPTAFDLTALLDEVFKRHQLTLERKALIVQTPETPCEIVADRDQMRLVLSNLVTNAVKFSPDGGRIDVVVQKLGDNLVVEVTDEGPGVPEEEREHIFLPFYHPGTPTNAHVQGTGIGLSVVREGMRAHGGEVRVLERDRRGATFQLVMPVNQET